MNQQKRTDLPSAQVANALHPAWHTLIDLCEQLGYGEIEKLKIQDGVPVLAELTTQKIKLT